MYCMWCNQPKELLLYTWLIQIEPVACVLLVNTVLHYANIGIIFTGSSKYIIFGYVNFDVRTYIYSFFIYHHNFKTRKP